MPAGATADFLDDPFFETQFLALASVQGEGVWSDFPPAPNGCISYTVIIDLDRDVLTVDGFKHHPLPKYPHDFLNDEAEYNSLHLPPPPNDSQLIALYDSSLPSIIDADTLLPDSNRIRRKISAALINDFMTLERMANHRCST
jgi:hypothetical protein